MSSYFADVASRVEELNKLAEPYLANRPDKSLEELWFENTQLGLKWFQDSDEDWDSVPEVIANIADGHTPFGPDYLKPGSLLKTLGLSLASLEAHAWNLNDYLNRKIDSYQLPFEIIAEVS